VPLNEKNDPEMSYRRGYQDGALEMFRTVERSLDPPTRNAVQTWLEKDIDGWRLNGARDYPPTWRLTILKILK